MSLLNVVFRMLNKAGLAFVEPRAEDGHGSEVANPSFANISDGTNALTLTNSLPSEGAYALPVRQIGGAGRASTVNASTTPLNAGITYTGTWELNSYPDAFITCATDQNGTLYVDLSPDGVNLDSTLSYSVDATLPENHRIVKAPRYIRVRFTNTSASNQTYLRLNTYFGSFGMLNTALNATIREDADAIVVRSTDAEIDIASGRMQGFSIVNKFGTNSDVDSGSVPEDIWEGGGTYTGFPDSTLETVSVFSASANDASAGTGAGTIRITGLDTNYEVLQETVTLNGVTPVATVGQFRRVHTATVLTAGSGGVNAGIITVRHTTTTANVFLSILAGRNQSNCSAYTVPAGYTAYMRSLHAAVIFGTSTGLEGAIWTRSFGGAFRSRRPFLISTYYRLMDVIYGGLVFTEKSDIVLRVTGTSDNNVSVNGGYDLILVKNI